MGFLVVDLQEVRVNRPLGGHEGDARNGQSDDAQDHEQDAEDAHGISLGDGFPIAVPIRPARVSGPDMSGIDANAVPLNSTTKSRSKRSQEEAATEELFLPP